MFSLQKWDLTQSIKMKDVDGIMHSWCKKCGKNECREFRPKKSRLICAYCGHMAVKHVEVKMKAGVVVTNDSAIVSSL